MTINQPIKKKLVQSREEKSYTALYTNSKLQIMPPCHTIIIHHPSSHISISACCPILSRRRDKLNYRKHLVLLPPINAPACFNLHPAATAAEPAPAAAGRKPAVRP